MTAGASPLYAGVVNVPNASFELPPPSPFFPYSPIMDSWQKTPKPAWYDDGGGQYTWDQLSGIFKNNPPTASDHIDNCDGNHAAWLFAVPEVGVFQDYDSMDWNDPVPTHDFNASYEVGKSYQWTVGVIGGGGGMQPGATLELSLYYRDAASNRVTVAATTITNSLAVFSNNTHLVDFTVNVPMVQPGDAWAGQHIGIFMRSTVSTNQEGGYWDLDNVRLSSTRAPVLVAPVWNSNQFQFTVESEPGLPVELFATTNATLPASSWLNLGTVTNISGTMAFVDTNANFNQRFYQARRLP